MTNGAAKNERLGHIFHFDGCLHPGLDADLRQSAAQCQRVDHGGKHSHVIRRRSIHATMRCRETTPDISSANYDRHLDTEIADLLYAFGNFAHNRHRDIVPGATLLERFAA